MIKQGLMWLKRAFSFLITLVVGQVTWVMPSWLTYLVAKMLSRPKVFLRYAAAVLVSVIVIIGGYQWYQRLPQPERIVAQITAPKITPLDKVLIPDVLTMNFGVMSGSELTPRSVAPLELVGKEVPKGIHITPSVSGKWVWESDSQLVFTPASDWPAGQAYTISFDKDAFAQGLKFADQSYSFSTQPFAVSIGELKLYQDPVNPHVRQVVATLNFNFPVDPNSLENNIAMRWQGASSDHVKYAVSYNENRRIAYLHSESLSLPSAESFITLTLSKGVKPIAGPTETTQALEDKVLIPDAASYFRVNDLSTSIVRNQKDRPEQIINIETSIGVKQIEIDKAVHVYVLPKDFPATAAEEVKINYEWKDPGEVSPAILALSKPVTLRAIPADRDYATLHSYQYNLPTPAYIFVEVDKGIPGYGDFVLAKPYATLLRVPDYPKEIAFLHKGALLALGSDEKLSVLVRGVGAVKFNFARVLPDAVNHLITQTNGDFSNPLFINYSFNQDNISEVFSQIQEFDISDPGKQQYTALDFNKYLGTKNIAGGPLGLFLLQATGWDVANKTPLDVQNNRLILVTDLGLIVKDNADGTHDVYVQSITKGSPINKASVSILGKNGVAIYTRDTDGQGHASFPSFNDFVDDREPTVYLARNGQDVSFIPYSRQDRVLNFSKFDIGGVHTNSDSPLALTAYIFTDRGIYRPGDTAHLGIIVKKPYVLPQPAGVPLEVSVVDPRGVTVKTEKLTLNDSGYLTVDMPTELVSPTGQYLVNVMIVRDNHALSSIGSANFTVAEFLPDRLRITESLSAPVSKGWISPDALTAKIGLWNLYGSPAANHRVTGRLLLTPQAVTFAELPNYTFLDPLIQPKKEPKVFTDSLKETQTDDQGEAEFDLNLKRFDKATYKLTVFAEGFELEGGRSVTAQTSALVSPLAYLVGYKADGDLSFVKQDGIRQVSLIAVNPNLDKIALADLTFQLFSLKPVSTLVKKDNGTYEYQSITQSSLVSTHPFSINEGGTNYTLPTQGVGDFLANVVDKDGTELARFHFSVVGESQQALPQNAELTVKLSKAEYQPGEDIEMQITAPYTGSGLITIERDKVYATQWFTTNATNSMQKIRIPADFQGNGYVNVAFVRDFNSPDIFMSPLSFNVIPFTVNHDNHAMKVTLKTPDQARPGDNFPIGYQTDKPGKIIVFAVDEGILQVSQYATPDPLAYFFQKNALEVTTSQIVDQILPKFVADRELSAAGGDNGAALINMHLNPFKRKTDLPVVYWSGVMDTDATERQLDYQIPDYFNGTLRVMAVAVAADAVGSASRSSQVRGYFVINPNVPTFVAPGDEFEITASIANNVPGSGANAQLVVQVEAANELSIVGEDKQTIDVPEGQERSVHFKVHANDMLGSATLNVKVIMGDKTGHYASTLSVRPATPYYTSLLSGYATDAANTLKIDRVMYPQYRLEQAAVSPSPLILMTGIQRFLDDYPYGCVEQLVSKALPWMVMSNQDWFIVDAGTANSKVQQTIQLLSQRQMASGGFNYWPSAGTTSSNDFATVYAMQFLTEARSQGFIVTSDVFSAGLDYLKTLAVKDNTSLEDARLHAYAIYVLTRNEIMTSNYLTNLQLSLDKQKAFNWREDITSSYMAATYQMLKSSNEAGKMIAYYKPGAAANKPEYDFYDKSIGDAQYLYLLAKHFPERLQNTDGHLVMSIVSALNKESMSTLLSGYTSLALSAYSQYASAMDPAPISISEILSNGKENPLSTSNGLYQKVDLSAEAEAVNVKNTSNQPYFYQLIQAGFDKSLPTGSVNHGIEAIRSYTDQEGKPVTTVGLGDEIVVHIRMRSIDNNYYDNVAIQDLLPGGFEVVRQSVKPEDMTYVDIREDRVIYFGTVQPASRELTYHIKATNTGTFAVPPVLAEAMYHPAVRSVGVGITSLSVQ